MARSRKGWGGLPIPAAGEVHWGMKGKVGKMGGFRRRRSFKRPPKGNWVSYYGTNQDGTWAKVTSAGIYATIMTAGDVIRGGNNGGGVGYTPMAARSVISRIEGNIWLTGDYEDDPGSVGGLINSVMCAYAWMKVQLSANLAGGDLEQLATDFQPVGDYGRLARFRKNIIMMGDVHVNLPNPPYAEAMSAYSGVTTGAATLNTGAPLDLVNNKLQLLGPPSRIPFPRKRIVLEEGQILALVLQPWTLFGTNGGFNTTQLRTLLVLPKYRAFHRRD